VSLFFLALVLGLSLFGPWPAAAQTQDQAALQRIRAAAQAQGRTRVIVELRLPAGLHVPEGLLSSSAAVTTQRRDIANVAAQVLARLQAGGIRILQQYSSLPFLALEVDSASLAQLEASGLYVRQIFEDTVRYPLLYQSGPLVHAPQAWASGYDGTGWAVASIDSGVESTHPFLAGKVVSESCYVSNNGCPNGQSTQTGAGSAWPQNASMYHGTHVAGIAAGNAPAASPPPASPLTATSSGMGQGAQIIAIQVFQPSTLVAFTSDIIQGLNRVYALRSDFNIASVNMSLGGGGSNTTCDAAEAPTKAAIDQLRSVNIATVVAAGNSSNTDFISAPACISTAVSVGSTDKNDVVSSFSNVGSFLSLFAPGGSIDSSLLNASYGVLSGTSMATPHVAGAWTVLKQAAPSASVTTILNALQSTGVIITDTRPGPHYAKPRIVLDAALAAVTAGPTLIVSTTLAQPGSAVTVTLTNGFGGSTDWLALTTASNPDTPGNFPTWTYVGAGVTSRTWTVNMPATPGQYQFRLFVNDGYTRAAASPVVTVANLNPTPNISSLTPSGVTAGSGAFSLTVTGSGFVGGVSATVGGQSRGVTFGSSNQLTVAVQASDVANAGSAPVQVTNPGTCTGGVCASNAVNLTVTGGGPTLTVNTTSVPPGGSLTVTLTNGPGGPTDWLALTAAGNPDTPGHFPIWTYVGAGVTSRTWTITAPTTPGQYEFRLFINDVYIRVATSPTVTVGN
jgi:Subtilase family